MTGIINKTGIKNIKKTVNITIDETFPIVVEKRK